MTQKDETNPVDWGVRVGFVIGSLSAFGSWVFFVFAQDVSIVLSAVLAVFCGALVAYPVGWVVYGAVSIWDGIQQGINEVRKAQAESAAKQAEIAKQEAEERKRKLQQRRKELYGRNAASVSSALRAVKKVVDSEAARAGWLGDIDFKPDTEVIVENFRKAHALQKVANRLSALDNPNADDRRILAEANATIAGLEAVALKRVELIKQCATEAEHIDESLKKERADARTAEERAELHAKLSGMLYGIEATPDTTKSDSAAAAVMLRVEAYREVKNAIQRARDESPE